MLGRMKRRLLRWYWRGHRINELEKDIQVLQGRVRAFKAGTYSGPVLAWEKRALRSPNRLTFVIIVLVLLLGFLAFQGLDFANTVYQAYAESKGDEMFIPKPLVLLIVCFPIALISYFFYRMGRDADMNLADERRRITALAALSSLAAIPEDQLPPDIRAAMIQVITGPEAPDKHTLPFPLLDALNKQLQGKGS